MIKSSLRNPILQFCIFGFFLRVAGQAVQTYSPKSFLPPVDSWQGSQIPYPVLLLIQILILGAMVFYERRHFSGSLGRHQRFGRWLRVFALLYGGLSLLRLGIGLSLPDAPLWFTRLIPSVFHLVLAAYLFVLSDYHVSDD